MLHPSGFISVERPKDVGILGMDVYIPKRYVSQQDLEVYDGVSSGKYTIGLGQSSMSVCDDREDVVSISLTVLQSLLRKYNISPKEIGRLEVGTESSIDKSKSVKTALMQLFYESGNTDIEGADTFNACYGATNALFSTLNWVESSAWDGRYGIVIAADIAVYAKGPARPTGGAAAVAMLIGPNADIVFDPLTRATHMEHAYDFYKPIRLSEYPEVDGKFSNSCYLKALDLTYCLHMDKMKIRRNLEHPTLDYYDYALFHAPYSKIVAKGAARIAFFDYLRAPEDSAANERFPKKLEEYKDIPREEVYTNVQLEKGLVEANKPVFTEKTEPYLLISKAVGNSYAASLYTKLVSLVYILGNQKTPRDYLNTHGLLFSYGSGLASSMFGFTIVKDITHMSEKLDVSNVLESRKKVSPEEYTELMQLREDAVGKSDYILKGEISTDNYFPGTYYVNTIDDKYRRTYTQVPY